MKDKLNVVDFENFKELKEIKRYEDAYGKYLRSLANGQLETEVNYLVNEFSEDSYGKEFFNQGKLILKEISSRATGATKARIELMNKETLQLL